jgi:hypothetical protein
MRTARPCYRLGEEIEVILTKEEGSSRNRFGKIDAELVRSIRVKTTGGKLRNYDDTINKMEGVVESRIKDVMASFKFTIPFKKH